MLPGGPCSRHQIALPAGCQFRRARCWAKGKHAHVRQERPQRGAVDEERQHEGNPDRGQGLRRRVAWAGLLAPIAHRLLKAGTGTLRGREARRQGRSSARLAADDTRSVVFPRRAREVRPMTAGAVVAGFPRSALTSAFKVPLRPSSASLAIQRSRVSASRPSSHSDQRLVDRPDADEIEDQGGL